MARGPPGAGRPRASTVRRGRLGAYRAVIDRVDLDAIRAGSGSPATTSRPGSRSSTRWPVTSCPPRAHLARPHRERRAAPGATWSSSSSADRLVAVARPPGRAGGRACRPGDGRPDPQRARPAHHAGQAASPHRRGGAAGLARAGRSAGPLPAAGPQGPGRHPGGPGRAARRDPAAVDRLERRIAEDLGFAGPLGTVGQVYPRSLDFDVVSALLQAAAGPANLAAAGAADGRPRAGHRRLPGRSGRIIRHAPQDEHPLGRTDRRPGHLLRGHVTMAASLVGDQWNEGDVSCSVVRRVVLPDAFLALDGLLETTLEVLAEFGAYPAVIEAELDAISRSWPRPGCCSRRSARHGPGGCT